MKENFKSTIINLSLIILALILILIIPYSIFIIRYQDRIYSNSEIDQIGKQYEYGIVFGAGTYYGEPNRILRDRLDTAANLYNRGIISKILLSGSNINTHEEIVVMSNYLIREHSIELESLLLDGYGLRSLDTCMRAVQVYGIDEAILITTGYHLPRSMFLCDQAGMETIGVSSTLRTYFNGWFYLLREVLANHKAIWDVLFISPEFRMEIWEK